MPMLSTNGQTKSFKDPFDVLSKILKHQNHDCEFWWQTTGKVFAQFMRRSSYPIDRQYEYLLFYYFSLIPEFGAAPRLVTRSPVQIITKPTFRSYMTDDHTPIEFSWQINESGDPVTRFSIDPIVRQSREMGMDFGLFEELSASDMIAPGLNLSWCRICAKILTVSAVPLDTANQVTEYSSQYFIGFDCFPEGIVLKTYFMPEIRSKLTGVSKVDLVSQCVHALSNATDAFSSLTDLRKPWSKVTSFLDTLDVEQFPDVPLVAIDCLPAKQNRLKVYCRTPLTTLSNLRRYLFLDGSKKGINSDSTLQRGLVQIELLWNLLFPDVTEDMEPATSHLNHPTGGLVFYYELRGRQENPLPKVYIPVRFLCPDDAYIVEALSTFYEKSGNVDAAKAYKNDIPKIFSHRQLNTHSGIHTYVGIAIKQKDIEVTSYFSPECYSEFEGHVTNKTEIN